MTEETRAIVEGLAQAFKEYVEQRLEGFEPTSQRQPQGENDWDSLLVELIPRLDAKHLRFFAEKGVTDELLRRIDNIERDIRTELASRLLASTEFVDGIKEIVRQTMVEEGRSETSEQENQIRQEVAEFLGLDDLDLVSPELVELVVESGVETLQVLEPIYSSTCQKVAVALGYKKTPASQKDAIGVYARYLMAKGEYENEQSIASVVESAVASDKLKRRK